MGCDIHMTMHYKKDNKWIFGAGGFYNDRCYLLFSVLANVRNFREPEVQPISPPKGLPDDYHFTYEQGEAYDKDFWMGEHSFSYLNLEEIESYPSWEDVRYDSTIRVCSGIDEITRIMKRVMIATNADDVRIVFGFDN